MSLSRRDLLSAVQRGVTLHELLAPRGLEVLAWFCVSSTLARQRGQSGLGGREIRSTRPTPQKGCPEQKPTS
jgi:hypothetical protein